MQTLEVRHFRCIAGFNQSFEAATDQFNDAAAQNSLLAEQIGFALFAEVGFDDARATATDGRAVGQADFQRFAGCVGVNSHKTGNAAAFDVFAAHGVTRAFRGHHDHVNAFFRLDQAEVNVQAVGECDAAPGLMLS